MPELVALSIAKRYRSKRYFGGARQKRITITNLSHAIDEALADKRASHPIPNLNGALSPRKVGVTTPRWTCVEAISTVRYYRARYDIGMCMSQIDDIVPAASTIPSEAGW